MNYDMPNPWDNTNAAPQLERSPERAMVLKAPERSGAAAFVDLRRLEGQIQTMSDWAAAQILGEEGLQRMEFER